MGGLIFVVCVIGIIYNLCKDSYIHNQKYFGTDREIQRNNPEVKRNRKAVEEILKKK